MGSHMSTYSEPTCTEVCPSSDVATFGSWVQDLGVLRSNGMPPPVCMVPSTTNADPVVRIVGDPI